MSRKNLTQSRKRDSYVRKKHRKGENEFDEQSSTLFFHFSKTVHIEDNRPGSQIRMCFCGVAERFESVAFIFRILNQSGISCTMIYFLSLVATLKKNIYNFYKNKTRTHSNGVFPLDQHQRHGFCSSPPSILWYESQSAKD